MRIFGQNVKSLRIRFAVGFGIFFTLFLAIALIFIYVSFANFRKEEFYNRLKDKALTTFRFLIDVEQIDYDLLRLIDKNTLNSLYDEKVMIFEDTTLLYNSLDDKNIKYLPTLFAKAKQHREYRTTQESDELVAIYIEQGGNQYTIVASAYDKFGRSKMAFLKWVMIAVYSTGLIIGWGTTYFFVKRIIRPLDVLKKNLRNINYNNLGFRLPETGQGEEVDSLSTTFNQMLERLQHSISFQRDFIHYASHELRTPLAAMVGLTENALDKPMSPEEANQLLKALFQQQQNLTNITNSLLLLSDNNGQLKRQEYPKIRLDEIVFRSIEIMKIIFPESHIEVDIQGRLAYESSLLISGSEPLILMSFNNLLKNALQYSTDKKVKVTINITQTGKEVRFINSGEPFSEYEKERIFTPFYRASNASTVKGYGLGLPLVKQILEMHGAVIYYLYNDGFNEFKIVFK
ncbi:MAG TPA: HAMP domain-containing sensor histidine kinase [Chitinophagaceae bacterium]